ncbi:hypothetical protein [Actinomyces ruminis]|uniref:hypothetical protein n=1 Tax=Actinomyces ruminis TaxID=1937003 RepID=UPI003B8460C4
MASARDREIAAEQEVVDLAYSELDRQLDAARRSLTATQARGASGTHQSRGERDAYAVHYSDLVASLEGVEDRLVFGRMDMAQPVADGAVPASPDGDDDVTAAGRRHYVGRIGLQDARHREVVLDWRAPLSRAFYQATASDPMGLVRRRHIDTRARRVIGLEDELIDVTAVGGPTALAAANPEAAQTRMAVDGLQGEGALIAAMSAARDGRMGDIVATIQAEQDRVVTGDGKGVLVVQGGPGTGKTAVALHRVAYLFYAERERLERSGVLLVGPSRTFLRYVEQVLPSLGETGVVSTTLADLVPGVHARGTEPGPVAELKSRWVWTDILRRAVRGLQRVPDAPRDIVVQGTRLQLLPADVREAAARARRSGKPHNLARETFVLWLLERLTDQFAAATHQDASDADTRAWIREDIRTARDARREINLCWMPTTPVGLLERLWSHPDLLARVAPELRATERRLLERPAGSELTEADVPLIDELAELLGPSEDAEARRARLEARRHESLVAYAAQAIESQELGDGMVSAEMLANRSRSPGRPSPWRSGRGPTAAGPTGISSSTRRRNWVPWRGGTGPPLPGALLHDRGRPGAVLRPEPSGLVAARAFGVGHAPGQAPRWTRLPGAAGDDAVARGGADRLLPHAGDDHARGRAGGRWARCAGDLPGELGTRPARLPHGGRPVGLPRGRAGRLRPRRLGAGPARGGGSGVGRIGCRGGREYRPHRGDRPAAASGRRPAGTGPGAGGGDGGAGRRHSAQSAGRDGTAAVEGAGVRRGGAGGSRGHRSVQPRRPVRGDDAADAASAGGIPAAAAHRLVAGSRAAHRRTR